MTIIKNFRDYMRAHLTDPNAKFKAVYKEDGTLDGVTKLSSWEKFKYSVAYSNESNELSMHLSIAVTQLRDEAVAQDRGVKSDWTLIGQEQYLSFNMINGVSISQRLAKIVGTENGAPERLTTAQLRRLRKIERGIILVEQNKHLGALVGRGDGDDISIGSTDSAVAAWKDGNIAILWRMRTADEIDEVGSDVRDPTVVPDIDPKSMLIVHEVVGALDRGRQALAGAGYAAKKERRINIWSSNAATGGAAPAPGAKEEPVHYATVNFEATGKQTTLAQINGPKEEAKVALKPKAVPAPPPPPPRAPSTVLSTATPVETKVETKVSKPLPPLPARPAATIADSGAIADAKANLRKIESAPANMAAAVAKKPDYAPEHSPEEIARVLNAIDTGIRKGHAIQKADLRAIALTQFYAEGGDVAQHLTDDGAAMLKAVNTFRQLGFMAENLFPNPGQEPTTAKKQFDAFQLAGVTTGHYSLQELQAMQRVYEQTLRNMALLEKRYPKQLEAKDLLQVASKINEMIGRLYSETPDATHIQLQAALLVLGKLPKEIRPNKEAVAAAIRVGDMQNPKGDDHISGWKAKAQILKIELGTSAALAVEGLYSTVDKSKKTKKVTFKEPAPVMTGNLETSLVAPLPEEKPRVLPPLPEKKAAPTVAPKPTVKLQVGESEIEVSKFSKPVKLLGIDTSDADA